MPGREVLGVGPQRRARAQGLDVEVDRGAGAGPLDRGVEVARRGLDVAGVPGGVARPPLGVRRTRGPAPLPRRRWPPSRRPCAHRPTGRARRARCRAPTRPARRGQGSARAARGGRPRAARRPPRVVPSRRRRGRGTAARGRGAPGRAAGSPRRRGRRPGSRARGSRRARRAPRTARAGGGGGRGPGARARRGPPARGRARRPRRPAARASRLRTSRSIARSTGTSATSGSVASSRADAAAGSVGARAMRRLDLAQQPPAVQARRPVGRCRPGDVGRPGRRGCRTRRPAATGRPPRTGRPAPPADGRRRGPWRPRPGPAASARGRPSPGRGSSPRRPRGGPARPRSAGPRGSSPRAVGGLEGALEQGAVPLGTGVLGADPVEERHGRPLPRASRPGGAPSRSRSHAATRSSMPGSRDSRAARTASAPLDDVRRDGHRGGASARPARWLGGGQPGRRQGRLGRHEGVVVRGREGVGHHRRAVARVEGRGDGVGRRAAGRPRPRPSGRPSTCAGARPTTPARSSTWAAVAANHIRALGVCSSSSHAEAGEEQVDGPVGVAEPEEHPQALRRPCWTASGSSWARCHARRKDVDRAVDVAEVEPQEASPRRGWTGARRRRSARRRRPGPRSSSARPGVVAVRRARAWSRCSQAGQSLRLSRGSASQAASSRAAAVRVAGVLREAGPRRVDRAQVVAVGAEHLLDVVDGGDERAPAAPRGGPRRGRRPTSAATARRRGRPGRGRARGRASGAARRSARGSAGRGARGSSAWVRSVRATNSSANEPSDWASRSAPSWARTRSEPDRRLVGRERHPRELLGHLVPLPHDDLPRWPGR